MVRVVLSGCNGAMGRVISRCAANRPDLEIVAGIDPSTDSKEGYPVFPGAAQMNVPADVIVDFSHPSALEGLLALSERRRMPLVLATTGLSQYQAESVRRAAGRIPVFFTANMSLGVSLMTELAKIAARVLGEQFDIEIVEKHHNRKLDAPSGTALMLAGAISSTMRQEPQYIYDRHSKRKSRGKNEIGIHAVRGGTIVGEHEVIFAGRDEVLTIAHSASSREVFATGSLSAAIFMAGKAPGLYTMADLI